MEESLQKDGQAEQLNSSSNKSALQHNIESKGNNAYYFAHAFKANGPKWDGKPEPRLLSKLDSNLSQDTPQEGINNSSNTHHTVRGIIHSSFDYAKSTITKYGFLDEGSKVKIYVEMTGVGENHTDEQIHLDYTESSFSLRIENSNASDDYLSFGKLYGLIEKATAKLKKDRIIITLFKKEKKMVVSDQSSDNTEEVLDSDEMETMDDGDEEKGEDEPTFEEWKSIGAQVNSDYDSYE
jgi:hypothetical protein